ncbi:MAG: copper resistance protein CopC [Actinomycetota bacterium]
MSRFTVWARWWRGVVAACLVLGVFGTALLGPTAPAFAHTDLLQASPGPGQLVGGTVEVIDLVFTEPITEARVTVTRDGQDVPGTMVNTDGIIIRFELDEPITEPGRYDVRYEMISFDLDDTADGFFFEYEPSAPEPFRLGVVQEPEGTNWVMVAASAVLMAALAGLLFIFVKRVDGQRRAGVLDGDAAASVDGDDDDEDDQRHRQESSSS